MAFKHIFQTENSFKISEIIWDSWKSHCGHPMYQICLSMHLEARIHFCLLPPLSRQGLRAFREMCASWG